MRAEIISIGDELTSGQRLDTNSQWLSERLGELGITVMFHTTVADDLAANVLVFRQAVERADLIICSGGLGPTADDLTRQALAEMAGVELVQDAGALTHLKNLFARRQREMPPSNLIQTMFPAGSRVIPNPHGSAPGIDLEVSRKGPVAGFAPGKPAAHIFSLPGVPAEMKEMWSGTVAPAIAALQPVPQVICHYRIKCFGVGESDLEAMLPDLIRRGREPSVGITVSKAIITLRITACATDHQQALAAMQPTIETIHQCVGTLAYGTEDDELQDAVLHLLHEQQKTLALVEWGTGGVIANWLADCKLPAGLSLNQIYAGGVTLASAASAESLLGVDRQLTGEAQVVALAAQLRQKLGTDYALATGPFPAPSVTSSSASSFDAKPEPGYFSFALASRAGVRAKTVPFTGHPEILKPRSARQALDFLRLALLSSETEVA